MRIEEFLGTLPESIMSGEEVDLQDETLREIMAFASLGRDDVFYHLGCGNGHSIRIALEEFGAKKAVGIDNNCNKISDARKEMGQVGLAGWDFRCEDIQDSDLGDATVILFWFSDFGIAERMEERLSRLAKGCRIITIWGPLPGNLPDKVEFPYILNRVPFRRAASLKDQTMAVFGTDCIDFITAWEFAERYSKAIASKNAENDRFLTILQTLVIWINAKNLGVACGDEIPPPISSYFGILKTYFGIEMEHLLDKEEQV